jgi:hypothetical protein
MIVHSLTLCLHDTKFVALSNIFLNFIYHHSNTNLAFRYIDFTVKISFQQNRYNKKHKFKQKKTTTQLQQNLERTIKNYNTPTQKKTPKKQNTLKGLPTWFDWAMTMESSGNCGFNLILDCITKKKHFGKHEIKDIKT